MMAPQAAVHAALRAVLRRDPDRAARVQSRIDPVVIAAALLVVPTLFIEEAALGSPWDMIGAVANWFIWLVFAGEVVVMLTISPSRRAWLREHWIDVAIVVLTPPIVPAALQSLRILRLLRLVRLLKVAQIARQMFSLAGLRWASLVALMTVILGGLAFGAVERGEHEVSAWDGIWWAITTVTTVGYGDYAPQTLGGRIISICVMGIGIGFVALLTAAAAERFISRSDDAEAARRSEHEEIMARLDDLASRLDRIERLH